MKPTQLASFKIGREVHTGPLNIIKCYLARKENTNKFYVIKVLRLTASERTEVDEEMKAATMIKTEFLILSKLQNCNSIFRTEKYFTAYNTESDGNGNIKRIEHLCLPIECYTNNEYDTKSSPKKDLCSYLEAKGPLSESESIQILHKIATAVLELETNNIYHGDLQPSSIIIDSSCEKYKLINFHLSQVISKESPRIIQTFGNLKFLPPELSKLEPFLPFPAHVFALGIIFYSCLSPLHKLDQKRSRQMISRLIGGEIQTHRGLSLPTRTLLLNMVSKDPHCRITTENVIKSTLTYLQSEKNLLHEPEQVVPEVNVCNN